jgi:PAP2 superfamily
MGAIIWRNAKRVVPIALVQAILYFTINHYPLFESRPLTPTWIDGAIPFWPWTMWPYLVMIFVPPVLPLLVRQEAVFREAMWAYVLAIGITLACHLIWPTHIERPQLELDGTLQTWSYSVMVTADAPQSCFPSGHVVGPAILCWGFWRDGQRLGPWLLALFPFFSLTILATKQHYFWDLLAGYALAGLGIGVSCWLTSRARP